jgi:putative spermidine/putrescine transport system ATP-binding protein
MTPTPTLTDPLAAPASAKSGVSVELNSVTHQYGDVVAVNALNLCIEPGELVALLGPSGCGKTTLLRIIAGLLRQTRGHVVIGGQTVDALPPNERGAGIVFQSYALFPHMTVRANVGYGLRARGAPRESIAATVQRLLDLVQMSTYADRYPNELSGGQQQRIALARTLAVNPKVLLLDEPFGALDKNLRLDMQIEVKRLQRELNITTVMVTHDQEEALSMADRIAVMNLGRLEQFAAPDEIYDAPASLFVAGFVGAANFLKGQLHIEAGGSQQLRLNGGESLSLGTFARGASAGATIVTVRPEQFRFVGANDSGLNATIQMVLPLGPLVVYELTLADGTPVKVTTERVGTASRLGVGEPVRLGVVPGASLPAFSA